MKRLLIVLAFVFVFALLVTGCELPLIPTVTVPPKQERPTVNVPRGDRQSNWNGSCVHATMISLFRWQGRIKTADYWRRTYGGGEYPASMVAKFDREGIRYAYVTNGDVKFLEWACKTRRGAGVTVRGGTHMVALVYLDAKWAALLDNNRVEKFIWVPREAFIAEWQASDGWSVTPVYTPAAPLPK